MAVDPDAFQQLSDAELAMLGQLGVRRAVAAGEYLYRESDPGYDFYVVLSGAVEIVVNSEGKERVIARHGAGRFLGELNLLTGQRVFVSPRVAEAGEVIAVPRDALRRLIATDASLSDKILRPSPWQRGSPPSTILPCLHESPLDFHVPSVCHGPGGAQQIVRCGSRR